MQRTRARWLQKSAGAGKFQVDVASERCAGRHTLVLAAGVLAMLHCHLTSGKPLIYQCL
jgi:hypothetical protein